jgi:hypothetical protein
MGVTKQKYRRVSEYCVVEKTDEEARKEEPLSFRGTETVNWLDEISINIYFKT